MRGLAGDREGAIDAMNDALSLDESNIAALNYIGYTYAEEGRELDEAERLIRKALVLSPLDPAILDSLGWVLFKQGKHAQALELLLEADRQAPDEPEILEHIAACHAALGEQAKAVEILKRALGLKPQPWVRERLEKALQELGE